MNGYDSCTELLLDTLGSGIVNSPDVRGRTPMHAAAYSDHLESLHMLLSHGGSVSECDTGGRTALMYACMSGQCAAIEALLEAGASLTDLDAEQNSALHYACINQQEDAAVLVLDRSNEALVNVANTDGITALHIAGKQGLVPVVQLLLSKGGE